jgi:hypothetical protein
MVGHRRARCACGGHHGDGRTAASQATVRTMRTSIDRLTALDQLMLRASTVWPQDVGALALLDGANLLEPSGCLRIEAVREAIASRLQLVPRFRQVVDVPRPGLGGPLWVDAAWCRRIRRRAVLGRTRWALVQPATGGLLGTPAITVCWSPKPLVSSEGRW